jgi:hypothetical protein
MTGPAKDIRVARVHTAKCLPIQEREWWGVVCIMTDLDKVDLITFGAIQICDIDI